MQIFVEQWGGDNMQFYPNFALFSTLGEMNLDQDFFQVSKLSEDQKKRSVPGMEPFFFPNSGEDQRKKKDLHQKWNTFFPRIQVQTCAQMHTRVKLLERMQVKIIFNFLEGIYPPHPPRVSAPLYEWLIQLAHNLPLLWFVFIGLNTTKGHNFFTISYRIFQKKAVFKKDV